MGGLFFVAEINKTLASPKQGIKKEKILSIEVLGAVSKPGIYRVPEGTSLQEVLKRAKLKRFADTKEFALKEPLFTEKKIDIPLLKKIEVTVKGDGVEEKTLWLPIKTRVCSLKKKVRLKPRADLSFFSSRRFLKDGQVIVIPKAEEKIEGTL